MSKKRKTKPVRVFSYGTLTIPVMQQYIWGEVKEGELDRLTGYDIYSTNNLLFICPGEGVVEGRVYELNKEQLKATDRYETSFYQREKVTLDSGLEAYVYSQNPNRAAA